ncbi:MAG TPA: NAD-dependent epimerase/dehydratase family protein [Polyangiales bacterium]|jgi:nucleoside-diphosphate-sugar epimerase|nr:NAD-dependent epimerase/dehydratase family protein [Polyangiales bacterium]
MATYLVTGATGFVGGTLVRRLATQTPAHELRVLVRDPADAQARALPETARRVTASLADPNAIAEAARDVDVIFHCAGEADRRASPRAFAWVNVAGTENVINAARHAGVRRVVHLSCADATLANRDRLSWKETSVLTAAPLDACARSQLLAEELALQASGSGLEVCALRPAWTWGPGDRRVLAALYEEAQRGRVQLCGNGNNLVPTVYVENLVDAMLLASEAKAAPGRAYHVLDAETLSASELLGKLCELLQVRAPVRGVYALVYAAAWLRARTGGEGLSPAQVAQRGRSCLFDGLAAARDLDYEPKIGVDEGMQALGAWLRELGGPSALVKVRRTANDEARVAALVRVAEAEG